MLLGCDTSFAVIRFVLVVSAARADDDVLRVDLLAVNELVLFAWKFSAIFRPRDAAVKAAIQCELAANCANSSSHGDSSSSKSAIFLPDF